MSDSAERHRAVWAAVERYAAAVHEQSMDVAGHLSGEEYGKAVAELSNAIAKLEDAAVMRGRVEAGRLVSEQLEADPCKMGTGCGCWKCCAERLNEENKNLRAMLSPADRVREALRTAKATMGPPPFGWVGDDEEPKR